MSQILYRGKRKDNNEWIYGYVIQEPNGRTFIGTYMSGGMWGWVEVEAETVGQYTGQKDLLGKMIFKGDILRSINNSLQIIQIVYGTGYYCGIHVDKKISFRRQLSEIVALGSFEVIGNRWDNPELMGKD